MAQAAIKYVNDGIEEFDYSVINDPKIQQVTRDATARIKSLQRDAIIKIGRELLQVKEMLGHGVFLRWLQAEFPWDRRTALNMMHVGVRLGDKWESVSHLPTTVLYKLAAPSTPPQIVEALTGQDAGRVVSPAELRQMINELKRQPCISDAIQLKVDKETTAEPSPDAGGCYGAVASVSSDQRAILAAVSLKQWLGDHFSEFQRMLADIEVDLLLQALRGMQIETHA